MAAKALKKLGPKTAYQVTFRETGTYTVVVEAIDVNEAEDIAQEMYNNEEGQSNGDSETEIIDTIEYKA